MTKRPSLRRIVLLVAAMVAGGLTVLFGADPASAHYSKVWGQANCDSDAGKWVVTWYIQGKSTSLQGALSSVALTPASTTPDLVVGLAVPPVPAKATGTQVIDGSFTGFATLTERTTWTDKYTENQDASGKVSIEKTCVQNQPKPNFSATSNCDGTVVVHLTNDQDATKDAKFTVKATGVNQPRVVAKGQSADVTVPKGAGLITILLDGQPFDTTNFTPQAGCEALKVSSKSDCTTLTVTVENPADNLKPASATVTSGNSDPQTITVNAGESKSVSFPATDGTTATVTFGGVQTTAYVASAVPAAAPVVVTWVKPAVAVCAPPTTPTLPTTGAHLGPVIAGGSGLLVVGAAVLFFLYRRRMTTESKTL